MCCIPAYGFNISQHYKALSNFFGGDLSQEHMVNMLLDKLEAHMKSKYNVPDWTGEYTWALHLAKHIRSTPLTQIKIDWIAEQIQKEAIREIREDDVDDHFLVCAMNQR